MTEPELMQLANLRTELAAAHRVIEERARRIVALELSLANCLAFARDAYQELGRAVHTVNGAGKSSVDHPSTKPQDALSESGGGSGHG